MKIAIVIAGYLRCFEKTHKVLFNHLEGARDADFFLHTWNTYEGLCKCPLCNGKKEHLPSVETMAKIDEVKAIYNPKSVIIENKGNTDHVKTYANIPLHRHETEGFFGGTLLEYFTMLYSWKKVKEMVEAHEQANGFQYDLIMRIRPDVLFETRLNLNTINPANGLYLPNIAVYYGNGCNDQIAIGNNTTMKAYLSVYDRVGEYCSRRVVQPLRPETILRTHLQSNHVRINALSMRYYILRPNGDILFPEGANMATTSNQKIIAHLLT